MAKRVNVLGDIRAEHDIHMLELAFYVTPDFRTLIESTDRPIVVGRRGTGKSALCYQLRKYWRKGQNTAVLEVIPNEDQVIGLRPLLRLFGPKYNQIKAGARIAWKYALLLEVAIELVDGGKFSRNEINVLIGQHVQIWRGLGGCLTSRVRRLLHEAIDSQGSSEEAIAGLAQKLQLADLQTAITQL